MGYFTDDELKCPCCGLMNITPRHRMMLDSTREGAGIPMKVTSGSRCAKHNKEVGGKEDSDHLTGEGTDISCETSVQRYRIIKAALSMGFTRIGVRKDFLHLGSSLNNTQEVMWLY